MFQWLVLAAVVAAASSEQAAEPVAEPLSVHNVYGDMYDEGVGLRERGDRNRYKEREDRNRYDERDDRGRYDEHDDDDREDRRDDEHNGPNIMRLVDPSNLVRGSFNAKEKEIIMNAYSPDYYEPTWILDYRYLKTGGRDYTRSDGGQIMILPKGIRTNEHKEYKNYDELLEFLRLKQLAEAEKRRLHSEKRHRGHEHPESYASRERDQGRENAYGWQSGLNSYH